jgi:hypothetical protein
MKTLVYWGCPPGGPLGGRRLAGILWNISRSWSTAASRFSSPSMTLRERASSSSVIWNALRCSITLRPFSTSSSTGSDSGNLVAPPLGAVPLKRGGGPVGVGRPSGLRPGIVRPGGDPPTYGILAQSGLISRAAGPPRGGLSGTWGVLGCRPVMTDSGTLSRWILMNMSSVPSYFGTPPLLERVTDISYSPTLHPNNSSFPFRTQSLRWASRHETWPWTQSRPQSSPLEASDCFREGH